MHDEVAGEVVRWHDEELAGLAAGRTMALGRRCLSVPRWMARQRHWATARDALHAAEPVDAMRIAIIADEFTEVLFEGTGAVLPLHPIAWRRQLERFRPEVLFVESAWLGHQGWWRYELSHVLERGHGPLSSIVKWCRRHDVPTIFWNKEDPVHFHQFLPVAQLFDVVLTTEATCVDWYRDLLGHERLAVMPFPINPRVHHPVNDDGINGRVMFAGSWIAGRFAGRAAHLQLLLDAANELGVLDIYARDHTAFPPPYDAAVRGSLPYRQLLHRARSYAGALNVNSVAVGRTMVARRVPELLGIGVPVISSPSDALSNLYGDLVLQVHDRSDARSAVEQVIDEQARQQRSSRAWRRLHADTSIDVIMTNTLTMVGVGGRNDDVGVVIVGDTRTAENSEPTTLEPGTAISSVRSLDHLAELIREGATRRRIVVVPDLSGGGAMRARDLRSALGFEQAGLVGWTGGPNDHVRHVEAHEIERTMFAIDLTRAKPSEVAMWLEGASATIPTIGLDDPPDDLDLATAE